MRFHSTILVYDFRSGLRSGIRREGPLALASQGSDLGQATIWVQEGGAPGQGPGGEEASQGAGCHYLFGFAWISIKIHQF